MNTINRNELLNLDNIVKISKNGVIFYIPKMVNKVYAFTKDNGCFQEIIYNSMDIFNRDIYITKDELKDLVNDAKNNLDVNTFYYTDLYFDYKDLFNNALNSIYNLSLNKNLKFIKENYHKTDEWKSLFETKAADGARLLHFDQIPNSIGIFLSKTMIPANKSDKISVNVFYYNNTYLAKFYIYKKTNILIENFLFIN